MDLDDKALQAEVTALAQQSTAVVVLDDATYAAAGGFLVAVAEKTKAVVAWFKPLKDQAHKLHKDICGREKAILGPLELADQKVRRAIGAYRVEQEAKRRAEEARLAAEARRLDEERLAAQAAALESAGETAMAAAVLEQAIEAEAPVVVVESKTPKVEGVSFTPVWKWRPIGGDRARAVQLVPREYLDLADTRITSIVKAMKGATKIPGIEVYSDDVPVVRT